MSFLLRNATQVLLYAEATIKRFRDLVNQAFQKNNLDISYDQWIVISTIYKNPGITQISIAEQTKKEPASISRILKLLEKKEMINRIPDQQNKRAKRIFITPHGDEIHHKAMRLFNTVAKDGFNGVHQQETNLFVRVIQRIQENFGLKNENDK